MTNTIKNEDAKLVPINEVMGAILTSSLSSEDLSLFKTNTNDYVRSHSPVDFDAEVIAVQNSNDEIHLTLPYYSQLDDDALRAQMLKDSNLDDVSGGEIFITIAGVVGALIGLSLTPYAAGAGVIIGAVAAGAAIGAGSTAVVVGGTMAGAIVGAHPGGGKKTGLATVRIGAADSAPASNSGGGGGK